MKYEIITEAADGSDSINQDIFEALFLLEKAVKVDISTRLPIRKEKKRIIPIITSNITY